MAAEVTNAAGDVAQLAPMVTAAKANLRQAGVSARMRTVLADAGYWSVANVGLAGVEPIIAPGKARRLNMLTEAAAPEPSSSSEWTTAR